MNEDKPQHIKVTKINEDIATEEINELLEELRLKKNKDIKTAQQIQQQNEQVFDIFLRNNLV